MFVVVHPDKAPTEFEEEKCKKTFILVRMLTSVPFRVLVGCHFAFHGSFKEFRVPKRASFQG